MKKYDLVLILEYYRSATVYLSIIKYLRESFAIGIYQVPIYSNDLGKNDDAQSKLIKACTDLGADLINVARVDTKVLLVPQRPLSEQSIDEIKTNVKYKSVVLLLGFAFPGIKEFDSIFNYFNFRKVYAIDKKFIEFLAKKRDVSNLYSNLNIVEVGLPYGKYPIFEKFNADYILAMPTPLSFAYESDKWDFLETINLLFKKIDPKYLIIHKPHNGYYKDQFASVKSRKLMRIINFIPGLTIMIKSIAKSSKSKKYIRDIASKLYTAHLYDRILTRTIKMEEVGAYEAFSLEAFLPNVKFGVIGGTSNTMWGALYFKRNFYNCVDIHTQKRDGLDKLYGNKRADNTLETNLQYFMVPYCDGRLQFDEELWNIIPDKCRMGDLIGELRNEITANDI